MAGGESRDDWQWARVEGLLCSCFASQVQTKVEDLKTFTLESQVLDKSLLSWNSMAEWSPTWNFLTHMQHFWGQRTAFAWQQTANPNNRVLTCTLAATIPCISRAARSRVVLTRYKNANNPVIADIGYTWGSPKACYMAFWRNTSFRMKTGQGYRVK